MYQQMTKTQHPHAVAGHGRRQHLTTTDLRDIIRQSFTPHHFGSRVGNKCAGYMDELPMPPVPERLSGMEHCGRSNSGNASHTTWCTSDARHSSTLSREFLMLITMGRSEDRPACIATTGETRDEEQEEQCCESFGDSVGARQSLTERQPGNSVEEGAERLRSSTDCDPEGRQSGDVLRTMRDVRESLAAHSPDHDSTGPRDEAEQSHSACVYREATGRNRTPFLVRTDTGA